jgi:TDG/mug DNA glycosylase family protein
MNTVTPNEIARSLGVTGLRFRNWLRAQKAARHPIVAGHEYRTRYRFTRAEADQLAAEFRSGGASVGRACPASGELSSLERRTPRTPDWTRATLPDNPFAGVAMSTDPGHRVTEEWMGESILTLTDLLRPGLRAVVVGINPSPVSVAAGHYYQGRIGQRFYARLAEAGVIDLGAAGFEDDAGFAAGVGFTDVVKRPTARAHSLGPRDLDHGRLLLDDKLAALEIPRVLFTFKAGAEALLGPLNGHGLIVGRTLAGAEVFVMPGPMERTDRVRHSLRQLADWWAS